MIGCTGVTSPVSGPLFTNVDFDGQVVDNNVSSEKIDEAFARGILGVAFGDASIEEAKEDGRIAEVASIDHSAFSVLFFYSSYCTIVKGI